MLVFSKAGIQSLANLFFVHVLADEDKFLHAVSVMGIPVFHDGRVLAHHLYQFLLWSCGVPLTCLAKHYLLSGLLEEA